MFKTWNFGLVLLLALSIAACTSEQKPASSSSEAPAQEGLSQEELEKGIGPIKEVELSDTIDEALAARGQEIFETKCSACHKLDQRFVGPPLGDVLDRRTPEFVMNMILNPEEMEKKHPVIKELIKEYVALMPNQQLTPEDARAVLEYLRKVHMESKQTSN